jgi:glycerophosphoryl diester phosphodiesterase
MTTAAFPRRIVDAIDRLSTDGCLFAAQRGRLDRRENDPIPENSLPAIDADAARAVHFFETDLQRTKDGAFVLLHDATIGRELNGDGAVPSQTLADLKALWKKRPDGRLSGERVATIEEAMSRARDRIFIRADVRPHAWPHFTGLLSLVIDQRMLDAVMFRISREDVETALRHAPAEALAHPTLLLFQVDSMEEAHRIREAQPGGRCIEVAITGPDRLTAQRLELVTALNRLGETVSVHAWDRASFATLRAAGARIFQTDIVTELM